MTMASFASMYNRDRLHLRPSISYSPSYIYGPLSIMFYSAFYFELSVDKSKDLDI